jgi:hypothetical protein
VNPARCVHLVSADEAEGYRYRGTYVAVCGELIDSSSPATSYSDDGEGETSYCPACLYVATKHNWAAGLDVGCLDSSR